MKVMCLEPNCPPVREIMSTPTRKSFGDYNPSDCLISRRTVIMHTLMTQRSVLRIGYDPIEDVVMVSECDVEGWSRTPKDAYDRVSHLESVMIANSRRFDEDRKRLVEDKTKVQSIAVQLTSHSARERRAARRAIKK